MWIKKVYDIETLINLFIYYDIELDGDARNLFIIHKSRNDLKGLLTYLDTPKLSLIGYNNLGFDSQVIQYIQDNRVRLLKLEAEEVAKDISIFASSVITTINAGEFPPYPIWKIKIPQMDLFKIWHFDNKAKRCGLKWVQFSINWFNIEEMPIHHTSIVEDKDVDEVIGYCINDVLSTREFCYITYGRTENSLYKDKDKIELRTNITKEFGFNCLNYNDVKIGDEINKSTYLKRTGLEYSYIKSLVKPFENIVLGDCIFPNISFKSEKLSNFLERLKKILITGTKKEFKEEIEYKGVSFTFGLGGIHSIDFPRIIAPKEDELLEDRDCASMHPATIINYGLYPRHLGIEWLEGFIWVKDKRIEAKALGKKDKKYENIAEAYKLSLNGGGFGKTGEEKSWQYDPTVMMKVTINNQLMLLMLCEMYLDNNIDIYSANTDGILIKYKKDKASLIEELDVKWQEITKHVLEYTQYTSFVQTTVNDYVAITPTGKLKTKGDFSSDFEIHKNRSQRIVPLALQAYYSKGASVEDTIRNHRDIYDFCLGIKSPNPWYYKAMWEEDNILYEKKLQKINRYFISNSGVKLIKCSDESQNISQVNAGTWRMTVFNKYEEREWKDYNINYRYYIEECYKIIKRIKKPNNFIKPLIGKQQVMF